MVLSFLALAVVAVWGTSTSSCVGTLSQRDPARFGVVRVAFGPSLDGVYDWRADQLAMLAPMETEGDAFGPDIQIVSEGAADVVLRAAALGGPCGRYTTGLAYAEVDPACTAGYLALRRAALHEVMHWYTWSRWRWVGHLCEWPLNAPRPAYCHPTIRCTDCVMSPGLTAPDDGPSFSEAYTGSVAEPTPAQADLDLIAACQANGRCE